jgi:hypothetical protein
MGARDGYAAGREGQDATAVFDDTYGNLVQLHQD